MHLKISNNIFIVLLLSVLLSAPAVYADQPDKKEREAYKQQMQVEKEQRKRQRDIEKDERKRQHEAKKEERKRLKEMKREERKRAGKARERADKKGKEEGLGVTQQLKSEGEKPGVEAEKAKGQAVAREQIESIQEQMQLELEEKLRKEIKTRK